MPFVHVHLLEGRDREVKEELARKITEAVSEVAQVPPEEVWVRLDEMALGDFADGGRTRAAQRDEG